MNMIKREGRTISKSILVSCILMVFCSGVIDANASVFLLESEINARTTYDDNINFPNNGESASVLMIKPKAKLTYKDNNWDTIINAHVAATMYSSVVQDETASYFDLGTAYQNNRNTYSITASYKDFPNRAADSSIVGLVSEQIDTTELMLAPKYTRSLTERVSLSVAYSFSDVDVNPNTSASFLPYETHTATGSLVYKLSQKSELSLVVDAMDYTSENNISEYEMLASKVGVAHQFSEMVSATVFAGFNTLDFTTRSSTGFVFDGSLVTGTEAVETDSSGGVYEATINAKWLELHASRATTSNTQGGLNETDKLRAKLRMQVTPLVGIVLTMSRSDIEELNASVQGSTRVKTTIAPAMKFTLTRALSLRAEYVRVKQDFATSQPGQVDSDSNKFFVNLKYMFPSI